jgi:hypothetical protein
LLHFEVHTLAEDRWLIDGIFSEKETAIEDAKLLLAHQQALDAVRVLRVEEKREGFIEATVYIGARPRRRRRKKRSATLWYLSRAVAPPTPRPVPRPPAPVRPRSAAPALLLLTIFSLAGFSMLLAHHSAERNWVWVFDRPEAQQQHELHSTWTKVSLPAERALAR